MRHIFLNYVDGISNREATAKAMTALSYMVEAFPEGERHALMSAAVLTKDEFDDQPTIAEIMSEYITSGRARPNFEHMVDSLSDMPADVKENIIKLGQNLTQRREDVGGKITEKIRERTKE